MTKAKIFHIFQVCPFIVANFNKNFEISDDILKLHYLVKRLTLCLIKLDKNCRSYYLKRLTFELYFSYTYFSNELLVQTFSEFLMDLDYLSTTRCWPMFEQRVIIIFSKNSNINRLLVVVQMWNLHILRQTIKFHLYFWKFLKWKFIW